MVAKLCTWAPERGQAIAAMREALDGFEVEGIGHNLPFLSAVMDHPRFVSGEITTGFIAEEFPDGFSGVVTALHVAEGDEVQAGQPLCTVEAMKMENLLRAERQGCDAAIKAEPGDSLAVDAVIMEFD